VRAPIRCSQSSIGPRTRGLLANPPTSTTGKPPTSTAGFRQMGWRCKVR
jgi:hypothetical protein